MYKMCIEFFFFSLAILKRNLCYYHYCHYAKVIWMYGWVVRDFIKTSNKYRKCLMFICRFFVCAPNQTMCNRIFFQKLNYTRIVGLNFYRLQNAWNFLAHSKFSACIINMHTPDQIQWALDANRKCVWWRTTP